MEMLLSAAVLPWIAFFVIVIALMAFDLGVLNKTDHEIGIKESLWLSAFYINGPCTSCCVHRIRCRSSI
jgi:tellurite resistance protein TerC